MRNTGTNLGIVAMFCWGLLLAGVGAGCAETSIPGGTNTADDDAQGTLSVDDDDQDTGTADGDDQETDTDDADAPDTATDDDGGQDPVLDDGDDGRDTINDNPQHQGSVTVRLKAVFEEQATSDPVPVTAKIACPVPAPASDSPNYLGEQDCDGDGGIVRYWTPSAYQIAFKRLAFVDESGDIFDVIADTGTLAAAEVLDLTSAATVPVQEIPTGVYPTYYAELYYHELTMPLYDLAVPQVIRVYVSDDNFPAEGYLGHQQGDITLIDATGVELGFVDEASLWQVASLLTTRETITGAGGGDPESGHLRGLYGDVLLWNASAMMQGADQDIFILEGDLDLEVTADAAEVTFSFDVQDAWFFEDFDNDQLFNPCAAGNLDGCGGEWSPVFNIPAVEIE